MCISALSREAHYTRNHHSRNTFKAFFCDFYPNADFISKVAKLKTPLLQNSYQKIISHQSEYNAHHRAQAAGEKAQANARP